MNYLYGDSTPFPIQENFLETLVGLTKITVELLQAEATIVAAKKRFELMTEEAKREGQRLTDLLANVLSAIEEQDAQESPLLNETAAELARVSTEVIEQARGRIAAREQATGRELQTTIDSQRSTIPRILEQFLLRHALPQTAWALSWQLELSKTPHAVAQALAISPTSLEALFQLDLPEDHRWAQPIKVSDILPQVSITLSHGKRPEKVALGRLYLTMAELSSARQSLVVQRKLKEDTQGFELTWLAEQRELQVQPFSKTGMLEETITLQNGEAENIDELFIAIAAELRPLIRHRQALKSASFNEVSVNELESPAEMARVLIESVASLVREIAQRSSSGNELALKRDLGDRRREELFVPVSELTDQINTLSEDYRRYFLPFGLALQTAPARIVEPSSPNVTLDSEPPEAPPSVEVSSELKEESPETTEPSEPS